MRSRRDITVRQRELAQRRREDRALVDDADQREYGGLSPVPASLHRLRAARRAYSMRVAS